jgi:polyvinyl alcohol dehydrogenase (cytochrome)
MAPAPAVKCGTRGRGCTPAILAAITAIPGAIFSGADDGGLRAYATGDGHLLWEYDTNRSFTTVNGVEAKGASMRGPGPIVASGLVLVGSGYGSLGGRAGNVLLAFGVE